jgi:hypothetical protein
LNALEIAMNVCSAGAGAADGDSSDGGGAAAGAAGAAGAAVEGDGAGAGGAVAGEGAAALPAGVELKVVDVEAAIQRTHLLYDRAGDEHYNIISALHKSMRGGDEGAAVYWLARMLEARERVYSLASAFSVAEVRSECSCTNDSTRTSTTLYADGNLFEL